GDHLYCQHGTSVKVLNVEDGKVDKCFDLGEEEEVTAFAVSPDEGSLAVSGRNGLLKQWDLEAGSLTRTWKSFHTGPISCLVFDSSCTLLASGGCDSTVKVWDVVRQYCTHHLRGAQGVFSVVQFHPKPQVGRLFGAADDYKIHVWDLSKSGLVGSLEGHFSVVTSLVFLDQGDRLLRQVEATGHQILDLEPFSQCVSSCGGVSSMGALQSAPKSIESLVLVPDSQPPQFITAGEKGITHSWRSLMSKCSLSDNENPLLPAFSKCMVIEMLNHIWQLLSQNFLDMTAHFLSLQFVGYNDEVLDVRLVGKEEGTLAAATNSPHVRLFQLSTFHCRLLRGHSDIVVALDTFASDPTLLVTVSKDNTLKLWRVHEDDHVECLFTGKGHTQAIASVACSRLTSSFVVTGSQDTTLKLWEVPERPRLVTVVNPYAGAPLTSKLTVAAHEKDVNSVSVSPNDQLIASASQDKTAKACVRPCPRIYVKDVFVTRASGHTWQPSIMTNELAFPQHSDNTLKLWRVHEDDHVECLFTGKGHTQAIASVACSRRPRWVSEDLDYLPITWENTRSNLTYLEPEIWEMLKSRGKLHRCCNISWHFCPMDIIIILVLERNALLIGWFIYCSEQQLSNLVKEKKWTKALKLALTLEHPFRALTIIKGNVIILAALCCLWSCVSRPVRTDVLLRFAATWNTNSKHSAAAQAVLGVALRSHLPDELLRMPNSRSTLEALLPYTGQYWTSPADTVPGIDVLVQRWTKPVKP
ncbi:WD-repeat protein, putative, partial [Ixodes scapularis]